jgi:hypothetical protein
VVFKTFRTLLQEDFHGIGIGIGKDKGKGSPVSGTYSTENMGIFSDDMGRNNGPDTQWCPAMSGIRYSQTGLHPEREVLSV